MPTDRRYTGQREVADLGLYDYAAPRGAVARYYDPYIGRFIQADTVIPDATDSQGFNRYSYVRNNPLKYNDPSGHCWGPVSCVVVGGLVVAGIITYYTGKYHATRLTKEMMFNPVYKESRGNDAQFISNLFSSNKIPGDSVKDRMRWIMQGTADLTPTGFMSGNYGVNGFNDSVSDGKYHNGNNPDLIGVDWVWPGSSDQVGHFITAAAWGYKGENGLFDIVLQRYAVGHELISDTFFPTTQVLHGQVPSARKLFNQALDAFANGEENWDAPLVELYNLGTGTPEERVGNSIEDLRCTVIGWQFGRMVARGDFATRQDAADWLKKYLQ